MKIKIKNKINKFNLYKDELEKYKIIEKENISLKNEIIRLKQQITQCNSNLVTISNTNESIIHEKDKIIKNFSNNIKELNKQIDLLNNEISKHGDNLSNSTILADELSTLRKNYDNSQQKIQELQSENKQLKNKIADIKSNYVSHDEDFDNIKKLLSDLNNKTELNLKKLEDNEKKFDICCGSNRQKEEIIFESNDDEGIKINNCINEIKDNSEQYKLLIEEIKNDNDNLIKVNKDILEIN
jgi:chromosome segregation ATPase